MNEPKPHSGETGAHPPAPAGGDAVDSVSSSPGPASVDPGQPVASGPFPTSSTRVDVLLAEDDEDLREALADTLEDAGYTTVAFSNGLDALEWLQETKRLPALVLIDMRMPVMDGWQFRERQIKDPAIAGVPVVMLSAMNDLAKLEGVEHLKKPVQSGALLAVLARHCAPRGEASPGRSPP